MRKIAIAVAGLATLCAPSMGQEWSGPYIGAEGALSSATYENFTVSRSTNLSGIGLGLVAGYLADFDPFVIGVEGKVGIGGAGSSNNAPGIGSADLGQRYYATLQAKVGVKAGKFLPYATLGAHTTRFRFDWTPTVGASTVIADEMAVGVIGGVGTEIALTDQLSAKFDFSLTSAPVEYTDRLGDRVRFAPQSVMTLGLNYHF